MFAYFIPRLVIYLKDVFLRELLCLLFFGGYIFYTLFHLLTTFLPPTNSLDNNTAVRLPAKRFQRDQLKL